MAQRNRRKIRHSHLSIYPRSAHRGKRRYPHSPQATPRLANSVLFATKLIINMILCETLLYFKSKIEYYIFEYGLKIADANDSARGVVCI